MHILKSIGTGTLTATVIYQCLVNIYNKQELSVGLQHILPTRTHSMFRPGAVIVNADDFTIIPGIATHFFHNHMSLGRIQ